MAETDNSLQIAVIRDRLVERAAQNAPQWHMPLFPVARANAGCLIVGQLLGKLPAEDATALTDAIISEQNTDGSWSVISGRAGDLSLTLEVVQALSLTRSAAVEESLRKAVFWLELNRGKLQIETDTLFLLGAITETPPPIPHPIKVRYSELLRHIKELFSQLHNPLSHLPMLDVLSKAKLDSLGKYHELLHLQHADGSWQGSVRSTVLALVAMRHAGLTQDDSAYERGWRFLRSQQEWNADGLVQNPCDFSNLMHATAIRSLITAGAEEEHLAGSALSLLHQSHGNGGWALGGSLPVDLFTTAIALDALSFVGDEPLETLWTRRRAAYLLLRTQLKDGGWPLYPVKKIPFPRLRKVSYSSIEVTALVVQALAFNEGIEPSENEVAAKGIRFLLDQQAKSGLWAGDVTGSMLHSTSRALEAISAVPHPNPPALHKGISALTRSQNRDGGWGEKIGENEFTGTESNPLHTAWVLRALQSVPQVPIEAVHRARKYLESSLDDSGLIWKTDIPSLPLPFGESIVGLPDLTTMWALEAWAPLGNTAHPRRFSARRLKGIFEGNK